MYIYVRSPFSSSSKRTPLLIIVLRRACAVSKPEWYVLRHFWAPVAVSKNGPLQILTNVDLKDGPLGGLFWDKNLIEVCSGPLFIPFFPLLPPASFSLPFSFLIPHYPTRPE